MALVRPQSAPALEGLNLSAYCKIVKILFSALYVVSLARPRAPPCDSGAPAGLMKCRSMDELDAMAIALMLITELAVAIACVAA